MGQVDVEHEIELEGRPTWPHAAHAMIGMKCEAADEDGRSSRSGSRVDAQRLVVATPGGIRLCHDRIDARRSSAQAPVGRGGRDLVDEAFA